MRGRAGRKYTLRERGGDQRHSAAIASRCVAVDGLVATPPRTGAVRRVHLHRHPNILKRLRVHGGAFNLGLVMRKMLGKANAAGVPRLPHRPPGDLGALVKAARGAARGSLIIPGGSRSGCSLAQELRAPSHDHPQFRHFYHGLLDSSTASGLGRKTVR